MTRYLTLGEYFWLTEQVTGIDANVLAKASRSDLADSAIHDPQAGFGDEEFYPDIYDKAAVLVCQVGMESSSP
jgi:death-on-curing protein